MSQVSWEAMQVERRAGRLLDVPGDDERHELDPEDVVTWLRSLFPAERELLRRSLVEAETPAPPEPRFEIGPGNIGRWITP